jgi:hypothetical protein
MMLNRHIALRIPTLCECQSSNPHLATFPPSSCQVREAISILDLDVIVRPCPRDGDVWRPQAIQEGGKSQFPYLKDPNTGASAYVFLGGIIEWWCIPVASSH